jgi:hypothetical protein
MLRDSDHLCLQYGVSSNWKVKADRDLLIARTE